MLTNLPDLVIEIIINNYLSYEDILNLSSTCKRIKRIIDRSKFKRLNIFFRCCPSNLNLFITKEQFNYPNSLRRKYNLGMLKSIEFKNRFAYIQQLTINLLRFRKNFHSINLNDFNCFINLIHLEINCFIRYNSSSNNVKGYLELNNLKIARFNTYVFKDKVDTDFKLNCPNLKYLYLGNNLKPTLNQSTADSIIYFTYQFEDYYLVVEDKVFFKFMINLIKTCKNIQNFETSSIELINLIANEIINDDLFLSKISSIKFKNNTKEPKEALESFSNILSILNKNSRTKNVKFYIDNYQFDSNEFKELIQKYFGISIERILRSFLLIGNNNNNIINIKELNSDPIFNCILENVNHVNIDDPENLNKQLIAKIKKLNKLELFDISKMDNDLFEFMIKKWRRVTILGLEREFTQYQLSLLPIYFEKLIMLRMDPLNQADVNYLIKFKNLQELELNSNNMKKEDILLLFDNLVYLTKIRFYWKPKSLIESNCNLSIVEKNRFKIFFKYINTRVTTSDRIQISTIYFDTLNGAIDYYCSNYFNVIFNE
jgi:hypothetical protein